MTAKISSSPLSFDRQPPFVSAPVEAERILKPCWQDQIRALLCALAAFFRFRNESSALQGVIRKYDLQRAALINGGESPVVSDLYFDTMAASQVKDLLKKALTDHIEKNLQEKKISSAQLAAVCSPREQALLKTAGENIDRSVLEKLSQRSLLRAIPKEEMGQFLEGLKEDASLERHFSKYRKAIDTRIMRLLNLTMSDFATVFSKETWQKEGAWKVFLGSKLADVSKSELPSFFLAKYEQAVEGLPTDFTEKASLLPAQMKPIEQYYEAQVQKWCLELFDTADPELIEELIPFFQEQLFSDSISDIVEQRLYSISSRIAEEWGGADQHEIDQFNHSQVEVLTVHEIWQKYRSQLSEEQFKSAYSEWGKFSLSYSELEELLQDMIAAQT